MLSLRTIAEAISDIVVLLKNRHPALDAESPEIIGGLRNKPTMTKPKKLHKYYNSFKAISACSTVGGFPCH